MGKELPLARSEKEGQSMLLAITGSGELITTSYRGDERSQEPNPSKGSKGGAIKDTEAKSKRSRKAKRTDVRHSGRQRRRQDNKNRESDRGDEGADKPARRSASELGITYPGSYCDDARTVPHYWFDTNSVEGGSLFHCRGCLRYLWLPKFHRDAERLGKLMRRYGSSEGYCRYLDKHRAVKLLVAKLQDLRRLETEITNKREFARLADKILSNREYDRKEE